MLTLNNILKAEEDRPEDKLDQELEDSHGEYDKMRLYLKRECNYIKGSFRKIV